MVLLEFLVLNQAGVAMEGVTCLWVAGAMLAEATLTWMLLKTSVVYLIMAICSLVFCVIQTILFHVIHLAEGLVSSSSCLAEVGQQLIGHAHHCVLHRGVQARLNPSAPM